MMPDLPISMDGGIEFRSFTQHFLALFFLSLLFERVAPKFIGDERIWIELRHLALSFNGVVQLTLRTKPVAPFKIDLRR